MKRTCNGCRALEKSRNHYRCDLGYKIEQIMYEKVFSIGAKPKEDCPKPKTYDEYLALRN